MEPLALEDISAFREVVRHGSFTEAARTLGVDKSSVSRRVRHLEASLGDRLLRRTTRSVGLTETGTLFYQRAGDALCALEDAAAAVRALQKEPHGLLRVTAPVDLGAANLGGLLHAFAERFSEVTLDVELTQDRLDLVADGFDVAIRAGAQPDPCLVGRPVGSTEPYLLASPTYLDRHGRPETLRDLESHRAVLFRGTGSTQRWHLFGPEGPRSVSVRGRLSTNAYNLVREAALAGEGIALIPSVVCLPDLHTGCIESVLPQYRGASGELSVVYPSTRFLSAKVRAFRDFAVQWLAQSPGEEEGVRTG